MKQFGPRFVGPKEAIAGTLALLALSPIVAGMVVGTIEYDWSAPVVEQETESPSETWNRVSAEVEASHCPDDILTTYWDQANVVLAEYRETHPRPSDIDERSPINGMGPEYNAMLDAFYEGWPAFAAANNCKLSGLEIPIGDLKG